MQQGAMLLTKPSASMRHRVLHLRLLCGNVTHSGRGPKPNINNEAQRFDGILLQEHHQSSAHLKEMRELKEEPA